MASTPTSRLRLNKQGTYDNPETWGIELNNGMIDMVDSAFGGFSATISGDVALTVENYTADQARQLFMILDGAGGFTITVPAVDKLYYVVNDCAANVTITPLAGTGAVVRAGTAMWWYCDGTDGFVKDPTLDQILPAAADVSMGGNRITDLADAVADDDATPKGQVVGLVQPFAIAAAASAAAALVSEGNASDSEIAAAASEAATQALYDDFQARYLGPHATAPTVDELGNPVTAGALYFNTSPGVLSMFVYDGANWIIIDAVTFASQAQAEAGTDNATAMTPLRTDQAIAAKRGAANGIASLDASSKVPGAQSLAVGVGQTWQTVSRTTNTSYQNATGRPILVNISVQGRADVSVSPQMSLDNATWVGPTIISIASGTGASFTLVVPPGSYYRLQRGGSGSPDTYWTELR